MDNDKMQGKWEQIKGQVRTEFGKLTDDDVEQIQGRKQNLIGKIQERYGDAKETATRKVNKLLERIEANV
jgi:uncharacterized protein YjbJ (UPF0337 family)